MNEFEGKLNAVLNNPAELERIARLAAELMGGEADETAPPPKPDVPPLDSELMGKLAKLLGSAGGNDKTALLQALSPYLKPERRTRLQKALRVAKMARLARTALEEDRG